MFSLFYNEKGQAQSMLMSFLLKTVSTTDPLSDLFPLSTLVVAAGWKKFGWKDIIEHWTKNIY